MRLSKRPRSCFQPSVRAMSGVIDRIWRLKTENGVILAISANLQLKTPFLFTSTSRIRVYRTQKSPLLVERSFQLRRLDRDAGGEITCSYTTDFEGTTRYERPEVLTLACNYTASLSGTTLHRLSGMQRQLIQGMQYLTGGLDLDGTIADSKLRIAPEAFSVPIFSGIFLIE
ncbi:uncharacterized protein N7446_010795 [Penicillium canescens]|uniref:Uncharacterized protein n=1 Tax=Penicillium canescens TaxID=5083 RepID=A0AAD6IB88_PENCN|nr:uncharacterized protein N7446_010795 [Penicillium canescens]KAJ6041315.1 hypothetical protein N7460_006705 [Penicillium canescens]KAJ6050686.1 hypothetical protein N7446_010795 [Penicillium canescens]KAJ6065905.1 hypothetical protein N7444_001558 [Penicillium canescens]